MERAGNMDFTRRIQGGDSFRFLKKAGRESVRQKSYWKGTILFRGGGGGGGAKISILGFPYVAVFKKRNSTTRRKSFNHAGRMKEDM